MKYIWEESDINAGRELTNFHKEKLLIVFEPKNACYGVVNLSTANLVLSSRSRKGIAEDLNTFNIKPA